VFGPLKCTIRDKCPLEPKSGWRIAHHKCSNTARKKSPAPRNSRELAVRNQFFTPRYVVEFLVDNTLGRIWYEMRKDDTALKDACRYLVRRPSEIFLKQGEEAPASSRDTHLGKLAAYLRMLGFDNVYRDDCCDEELDRASK